MWQQTKTRNSMRFQQHIFMKISGGGLYLWLNMIWIQPSTGQERKNYDTCNVIPHISNRILDFFENYPIRFFGSSIMSSVTDICTTIGKSSNRRHLNLKRKQMWQPKFDAIMPLFMTSLQFFTTISPLLASVYYMLKS